MKVSEALKQGPTLSFEFFPPKTPEQEKNLFEVLGKLKEFNPDFASVTYGAMGTTREKTFFWVDEIKRNFKITPVAHLTCVAAGRKDIFGQVEQLHEAGINNILALRGDPPEGDSSFQPPADGFHFARELVSFIKGHNKLDVCLGVAGYPEGHREASSLEQDIQHLKEKVDAGAEYIITQLFFDNRYYFDFLERCQKAGINVPIIPGIMPITSLKQVKKMTDICGASIPEALLEKLEAYGDDKISIQKLGIEHAVSQCQELQGAEAPGLHFFVMNQAGPISEILKKLTSSRLQ